MRRMNQLTAAVMVMAMIVAMTTVAYADTAVSTEDKARTLYDLGLFDGISNFGFAPNLNGSANREQAAKMVVVALGWTIDGNASSSFSDVSDWAQPYVAKAVDQGLTNGVGKNRFGAQTSITLRQLSTWFDRMITGSASAWDNNADLDNTQGITRGDLVDATYDALKETPAGESKSLIETIVGDDAKLKDVALKGGLLQTEQAAPEQTVPGQGYITGVDVISEYKIVLNFAVNLDSASAQDEDNYMLYISGNPSDDFQKIELSGYKQVTVTFEDSLSGECIMVVDGVKDTAGNAINEYEIFRVESDGIASIKVSDSDEITVVFSDDLEDRDSAEDDRNYEVTDNDGDEVEIVSVEWAKDNTVKITFEDDLDSGKHTLEVEDVERESGTDIEDTKTFSVVAGDGTEIETIKVTDDDEIIVTFTEDLDEDKAEKDRYYEVTDEDDDEVEILAIEWSDDDEVTITFKSDLDDGSYTLDVDGVEDEDGVDIEDHKDFKVSSKDDVEIDKIKVTDDDEITVTFTDDVDEDKAERDRYYEVKDEDGDEMTIDKVEWTDDDEVTITFEDDLADGDYTLEVDGVEDEDGNDIEDDKDFEVDNDDGSNVTIRKVEQTDDDEIVVTFTDDVDEDSADNRYRYEVTDEDGDEWDIDEVEWTDDDEVTITFEDDLDDGDYTLEVDGVEDEDGEDIEDSYDFDIEN